MIDKHAFLLALAAAAAACAGAPAPVAPRLVEASARPRWQFPSRAELEAIAAAPRAEAGRTEPRDDGGWAFDEASLAGPPGATAALARTAEALGGEGSALAPSPALACAAREFSRLRLAKNASPSEGLRRYLLAHCGSRLTAAAYAYVQGEARPDVGNDEIVRGAMPKLRAGLAGALPKGAEVGVALVRDGHRVVVSSLVGAPALDLEPPAPPGDADDAVTLRGALHVPADRVLGLVNRGARGVARCVPAPGVEAPRFELRCPLAPGDREAWVEIVARAPNRPLFDKLARVLVRRPGPRAAYAPPRVGAPAPVRSAADFEREALARLNALRRDAGLRPLEPAGGQSADNARLAGPFFDAEAAGDARLAGRIALGLSAGWGVDGLVRQGHFGSFASASTDDVARWLGDALEQPTGRWLLLEPGRQRLALGSSFEGGGLGALVTTYELFDESSRDAEAMRVWAALAARRAAAGLPPATRLDDTGPLRDGVRRFEGGEPARRAFEPVLAEATSRFGREVYGTVLEAADLDELAFPAPLLDRLAPAVAVEVGRRRSPGEPWGHYAAFVAVVPRQVRDDYRRPPRDKNEPAMPENYAGPRMR